jgi:hypothetical protein
MTGEVVFLAFANPKAPVENRVLSCGSCRNKAFTVVYGAADYPALRCTACGEHMGRLGWVHDDDKPEVK